jgi:hypothetical protein
MISFYFISEVTESSSPEDNKTVESTQDLELTSTEIIKQNGNEIDNEVNSDDELDKEKQLHCTGSYGSPQETQAQGSIGPNAKISSGGVAKYSRTGNVYSCKSCTYATDKKALLLKHVKSTHGQALSGQSPNALPVIQNNNAITTTDESDDNEFHQISAPQDRYCTNCDIQFNSYKTYKVFNHLHNY